ncbi:hypothetical protein [Mesorhizobium sp. M7A.F.Ca.CA.002.12.1.1]|uniref:portal protein n=1 Tax=Mesorhizobium sp. M7A.F.Ca.CA.002.12.1.1 TaxID=2496735 RepID=UPI0019D1E625|nr:hypothetical protein [Mesorhizobium sp. M7A.F.Ca.CA.002.12.1.1]
MADEPEDFVPRMQDMAPNLTKWANEPTVRILQSDLEAAKPAHDTFVQKVQKWRRLNDGGDKPPKIKGRSQVQPKLIRRQAEWRYSALTEPFNSSDKLFDVKPVTFEDGPSANQNELLLNWQFRTKLNRVNFIDDYVRANVDEGTAIVRVGWCRTTVEVEEEVPVWSYMRITSQEEADLLQQAIAAKQDDPRSFDEQAPEEMKESVRFYEENGQPAIAQKTGTEKVKVEKIIENRPTLGMINPENFYWDPSCGGELDKAGFVVLSFETSKAELKKEPKRYKNLEFVNWEAATPLVDSDHANQSIDTNFNYKDTLRKRIVAYEYWGLYDIDGTGELKPIVATWIGDVCVRMEENPFPDGKPPFVLAPYMPIKRQLMGEPDAELLEDNQKILGAVSRGMIDLLGRSANGQQGFAKGMLDVLNRRRFENGQDYEFNPGVNPAGGGHIEHKYPEIPQSALAMLQMQNQEAEALTGVKAFSGGLSGNAYGDVAAGIRGILDAAAKREMSILRRLAAGLVLIGKKVIAMNAVFLSDEEIVRVTNEKPVGIGHNGGPPLDDKENFVSVKRDELHSQAGEFDLKVDISTAEIDNNQAQDLAFMLQTMGNNMDFNITKMILVKIAKLKRMPDLAKQIERFEPKPDPKQQQLLDLQIQKEQMEIQKLQSEIQLNQAKAQAEAVRAEQGALDTVEQESGTAHAREMEKQRGQAEGNQDLEITKALVKPKKQANGGESDPDIEAAVGWNSISKTKSDPLGSRQII